jgi:Rho family protein
MMYILLFSHFKQSHLFIQRLRPLSYAKSHVILIAFAIDTPDSLENVTVKVSTFCLFRPVPTLTFPTHQWIEEVRSICGPNIPVLLVGCKADLRPPPSSPDIDKFVSRDAAERIAIEIGARSYKECSALKIEGVDDVFEAATRASMLMREGVPGSTGLYVDGDRSKANWSSGGDHGNGKVWKCCVVC